MPWVRFIVYSITLLSIYNDSEVARYLKSCILPRICPWQCTLTKFFVSNLYYKPFPYLSEAKAWAAAHALSMVMWSNQQNVSDLCCIMQKVLLLVVVIMC